MWVIDYRINERCVIIQTDLLNIHEAIKVNMNAIEYILFPVPWSYIDWSLCGYNTVITGTDVSVSMF